MEGCFTDRCDGFLANAFWLMPYMVSAIKTPATIQNTRINQFGSEEIFYRNKAHGTLTSTLGLNGFMMSTIEYDQDKNSDVFHASLAELRADHLVQAHLYQFLAIAGFGIIQVFRKKQSSFYPYLAASSVAFIFLANNTAMLEQLNSLFGWHFRFLVKAIPLPFPQIRYALCFRALTLSECRTTWTSAVFSKKYTTPGAVAIGGLILLLAYTPVFQGNFTSPLLREKIPQDYFESSWSIFKLSTPTSASQFCLRILFGTGIIVPGDIAFKAFSGTGSPNPCLSELLIPGVSVTSSITTSYNKPSTVRIKTFWRVLFKSMISHIYLVINMSLTPVQPAY